MSSPYELLQEFRGRHRDRVGGFAMSRLILLARIIPEEITPELESPALAARLEQAIARIDAHEAKLAAKERAAHDGRPASAPGSVSALGLESLSDLGRW